MRSCGRRHHPIAPLAFSLVHGNISPFNHSFRGFILFPLGHTDAADFFTVVIY